MQNKRHIQFAAGLQLQVILVVKNPLANAGDEGDLGSIPGSGRSPGGEHGHPLHGQRSLAGRSPWGHKKSDMTERRTTHTPGKKQSQDVDTF